MARGSTGGVLGMLAEVKDPVRLLRRIAVTVVGTVILAVGVVLLVAPGPGLVVIALALAVFAIEYQWARRNLAAVQERARSAALKAAASRPADLLAVIGWNITDAWDSALPVCAVLRSWEDRFGARLLQIGPSAEIRLLVDRPPGTTAAAQGIAAEQWAFCSTWIDQDSEAELTAISEITPRLLNAPIWGFWWD